MSGTQVLGLIFIVLVSPFFAWAWKVTYEACKGIDRCPYCNKVYVKVGDCGCSTAAGWAKMIKDAKKP